MMVLVQKQNLRQDHAGPLQWVLWIRLRLGQK